MKVSINTKQLWKLKPPYHRHISNAFLHCILGRPLIPKSCENLPAKYFPTKQVLQKEHYKNKT